MNINTNNYKIFTVLIVVLISVSTLLAYLIFSIFSQYISQLPVSMQIFISIPSVPAIYVFLFFLFDKYLWKLKMFKSLGLVIADDLNGKWIGIVKSSYEKFATNIDAQLVIKQTATKIKIHGIFNKSKSVSIHENFGRSEIDNKTALFYFFRNEPEYDAVSTMAIHEGSTKLTYNAETDSLTGDYYSGRDRNNYGTIEVKRVKSS